MTKKFELFFERIKRALDVTTDKELGQVLDLNKSTLSMWKKREKVDYELLFNKCEHINLHWLLTGEGEMLKGSEQKNIDQPGDEKDRYLIDLQKKHIEKLEEEIQQLKKEQKSTYGYRNVAEPDS